ncbi:hypothetical protein ZWY2020_032823 [Hordeum vulgare]|nr:hypothetical protein ZWY2020_032823 [Hordeum vulgare]
MAAALLLVLVFAALCLCVGGAGSTDTVSAGRPLAGGDARLVSNNRKFALGFFQSQQASEEFGGSKWYLGIWFSAVPDLTTVWVANGANPILDGASPELAISADGDLAVFNRANATITWSTKSANGSGSTANDTSAVLLNSGNLVLLDASNHSGQPRILWQSFDHPTDTLLPSAKLGRDKLTGLNRRLVSNKTPAGPPSPGAYCYEVDSATPQLVLKLCDSSATYWATGSWNGKYFAAIPELSGNVPTFQLAFVDNGREEYLQYNVTDEAVVTRNIIDAAGQNKHQVWLDASRGWLTLYATPKGQCDVYGVCGPNTVCAYSLRPLCSCMKGFSVWSPEDWAQGDRSGGCVSRNASLSNIRDTQLDCNSTSALRRGNTSVTASGSGDKFFSMTDVSLPDKAQRIQAAESMAECSEACLSNCSCFAYAYAGQGCLVWTDRLLNAKLGQSNGGTTAASDGETLYLRLAASEMTRSARSNRRRRAIIGVAIAAGTAAAAAVLVMVALMMRRSRTNNVVQDGGLVAFRYRDLRSATKNFSEKIGEGGFGSVFKGQLRDTDIAVKRLDGSFQGEKQFRAGVSSIGVVRHVNLVKLIGFCCDGDGRFLVYEHMPNRSLNIHLFGQSDGGGGVFLDWSTRYQIAVGVARGLAYLHEGCRDRIIHCDVKPQNILLDVSLRPKIADFGMAKFVGRDFSRALTTMRGTMGYLAPEWISGTPITPKVDVYSYGMVLLELVSGRRNSSGGSWTWTTHADDGQVVDYFPVRASRKLAAGEVRSLLDESLCGEAELKEVERACKVACWCIQEDEAVRPAMGQVVQILEGVLDRECPRCQGCSRPSSPGGRAPSTRPFSDTIQRVRHCRL